MIQKLIIFIGSLFLVFTIFSTPSSTAQTSPTTQPLVQKSDLVYLGKFTVPSSDGSGRGNEVGSLAYGGVGLGMGPDGASLYYGCHDWHDMLARVSIPAIGQVATVRQQCTTINSVSAVQPGNSNGYNLGGSLVWNGKLAVTAYPYYDANGQAVSSHFSMNPDMTSQSGPFRIGTGPDGPTDRVGMVSGYMGIIPTEWRTLLGFPVMVGQFGIPIISRTSFGPSVTAFDPVQLGGGTVTTKMLLGYPNEHQDLGGYAQSNPTFGGADTSGGFAFPVGTRSVIFFGRHGATFCYGQPTNNQALHGQPVPNEPGNFYCYDPTKIYKGVNGFPYNTQVWAYDANDLLAVKNGTKQPWDLRPYGVWNMPDIDNTGYAPQFTGGVYDPVNRRMYLAAGLDVHVYQINIGTGGGGGDITPPNNVSVTSPSSGSTVSDSITLSANASDDVGVAGVQFKVDGVSIGSEDTTLPYSISWDSKSVSNGSHTITAVARDAAYNTTISSVVTISINNYIPPPPVDLMGYWNLDEASGVLANDSSVNNNVGTLTGGSVFTSGKIGNAVSFDGINDYIDLGNPASLVPGNEITLSAWVNLDDNSVARMIISKEDGVSSNVLYLRAQANTLRCSVGGTQSGDFGTIYTNTWHHVACTYNGSSIVTYVNGVQVASVPKSGSVGNNTGNWNIGSRSNGTAMLMKGRIDDVRIYGRGLSALEVMSLYNAGNSNVTDTVPPTISITTPTNGSTVSGSIPVSATASDNVGVAGVQFKVNGADLGLEDMIPPYSFNWVNVGPNGNYTLSAVARDAAGNTNTSAVTVTLNNPITYQRTLQIDPEGRTSKVLTGTLDILNTSKTSIKTYPFTTNSSGQATITFDISPQVVYLKLNPIPFLSRLLSLDLNTNTTYTFPKLLIGDINQDNLINSIDYSQLNSKWFTSDATSDLNKDGLVNSIDFSFMNRNWLVGGEV